jgi:ankyrin repeat protein
MSMIPSPMTPAARILLAAKHGSAEMVGEHLAADPAAVNAKGEHDKTPLHWAAEKNHLQMAKVLIQAGADINAETTWGSTPLQWAANMGSREVADLLLEHGARPQLNMWAAAGLGMLDVVESFWDAPTTLKPNAGQTRTRRTPDGGWGKMPPPESYAELVSEAFYIAARNGHIEVAEFLLGKGADINCKGFFGAPGLHWAAINGHKEMVEFLIDRGADLQIRDEEYESTPLGWALEGKQTEIAALLEQRGVGP